jgi:phosphatidylethanolamine/phosphatidyl-N-methylethanolamine N-methyltransferase
MAPMSRRLGWHPDFATQALFEPEDIAKIESDPERTFGIFTLVRLRN